MSEQFSILIDSRTRFETSEPGGVWLSMPTTKEQLHEAMQRVGITADNPQDFLINGFMNTEQQPFDVPLPVIQSAGLDELNYLGNLLSMQRDEDRNKFTAAVTLGERAGNIKDLINLAQNLDCYWLYPTVQNEEDYGYYLIDELDELELPEEAKKYFMYEDYGRDAAINDGGRFTEQGYIYNNKNTFTEWYNGKESDIPREYKVMSFPQPERPDPSKVEMDAAAPGQKTAQTAEQPQEPRPVIPIVLTSEKPAEKLKEITDRLEQGITELFESERYREYLRVMSKFHNYSFNNTLLIAMQKPDASLVAGFSAWKNNFGRNVMKGQKGIKIIAPSPYKVKHEMKKIDPHTQQPIIGKDGKPVTEEKEITIPAYKVVSVFDVSQTEGKELPDIAVDELTGDVERYYDNDLVVAKPDGSPISASWVSSQFGKLLEDLDMPHIRFHDLRHTAATNMHQLTGDFYTVGEVLGHTLAGIGVSLGLSMNFEAVTARYVDVRLERKKEVLDAYHGAVKQADPAKAEKAEPKKAKSAAKKKSSDLEL